MSPLPDADIRRWVAIAEITDLIHRYSDGVTRADWEQVETVFAADAVWESPLLGLRFEGARSFLDVLVATTDSDLLIQTVSAPVVRLVGDERATATTTVTEFVRATTPMASTLGEAGAILNVVQTGVYEDEIARVDGEWRFTRRHFVPLYVCEGAVSGDAVAPRASLAGLRGATAAAG